MKRVVLVLLIILLLVGASKDKDNNEVEINTFLFGDDRRDAVRPEPIATAKAEQPKRVCEFMGLVIECRGGE